MTTIKRSQPAVSSTELLAAAIAPLLELFAVVEDVFTEEDALAAEKRATSLGRIYRQWKKSRSELGADDEWNT
jgi:hypothetical protein